MDKLKSEYLQSLEFESLKKKIAEDAEYKAQQVSLRKADTDVQSSKSFIEAVICFLNSSKHLSDSTAQNYKKLAKKSSSISRTSSLSL